MAKVVTPLPAGALQFRPPAPITAAHDLSGFTSRHETLNEWLRKHALKNEGATARTYVVALGHVVVGYYTLASGGVARATLPRRFRHNSPEQIPLVVLGRLATDRNFEGRGIGSGMLQEAIRRTVASSQTVGVRGLLVHAIDDDAAAFYKKYDFLATPTEPRTLLLPVETAIAALG